MLVLADGDDADEHRLEKQQIGQGSVGLSPAPAWHDRPARVSSVAPASSHFGLCSPLPVGLSKKRAVASVSNHLSSGTCRQCTTPADSLWCAPSENYGDQNLRLSETSPAEIGMSAKV